MADCLPVELLELIFENLTTNLSDLYACRSVCSQWHRAATTIISSIPTPLLYASPLSSPTFSIQIHDQEHQHNNRATLVTQYCNKNSSRVYDITLPDSLTTSNNAHITHKGWFLSSDDPENVFVYSPLSRETIKLPKLLTTCHPWHEVRFITSSTPTRPNSIILAHYISARGFLRYEFCTPGDDNWTSVFVADKQFEAQNEIHDMIYYNGVFYAVNKRGFLLRFDLSVQGPRIVTMSVRINDLSDTASLYLVESPSKELILVTRYGNKRTNSINVYKLDWGRCNWEKMSSFGEGESIFLAHYDSMFIKTDDYRSNCVYFFDDSWGGINAGDDCGFYDMKSGTIQNVNATSSKFLTALFYRWFKG